MSLAPSGTDRNNLDFLGHPAVFTVSVIRISSALLIFLYPFWGFVLTCILDILDAQVLIRLVGISREKYHLWDKNMDWLTYVVMLTYGSNHGFFLPLFLLLFFRFAGQFMFLRTGSVRYFILFPNFFEAVFLWFILFYPASGPILLQQGYKWPALALFVSAKYVQEISLHLVWTSWLLPRLQLFLKRRGIRYL